MPPYDVGNANARIIHPVYQPCVSRRVPLRGIPDSRRVRRIHVKIAGLI